MNGKAVSGIMLTLLLIGLLTLTFSIQPIKASGTIYIKADGSVDPDTAPIVSVDNVTYTFTDNIYDQIVVEGDNIVVDGAGYTLEGTGSGTGIDLSGRNNVTVKNTEIRGFRGYAVYLYGSSGDVLSGNNITDNWGKGVYLDGSSNNIITANNVTENSGDGIVLWDSSNNTISGNNVTRNYEYGIWLHESSNNTVSGNTIKHNPKGVYLAGSSYYNTINGNNITNSWDQCIELEHFSNCNTISGNTLTNNGDGIFLWDSSNNTISGNNIRDNGGGGIGLTYSSHYNNISGNTVTNHYWYGIYLYSSCSHSIVYHNNFIDNRVQVWSPGISTVWDDGYPSGGNYWSDHVAVDDCCGINQDEPGSDGIVDEPYIIDDYNRDNYPLVEPWSPLPKTIDALKTEIEKCLSEGDIDNQGIAISLLAKLNAAQKSVQSDGPTTAAKNILKAFINEVQAQSGKHLTSEATELLIQSAEYILSDL